MVQPTDHGSNQVRRRPGPPRTTCSITAQGQGRAPRWSYRRRGWTAHSRIPLQTRRNRPTGDYVALASLTNVFLREVTTGDLLDLSSDDNQRDLVATTSFSSDGSLVAVAFTTGQRSTVRIWNARSGKAIGSPREAHDGHIYDLAFSRGGDLIAAANEDGSVRLWDLEGRDATGSDSTATLVWSHRLRSAPTQRCSPQRVRDGTIRLWDPSNGEQVGEPVEIEGETSAWVEGPTTAVAFTPTGLLVSVGLMGTVTRWGNLLDREEACQIA